MEKTYHGHIIERAIHYIVENYRSQPSLEEVSITFISASITFNGCFMNGQV
ncbi:hypothetical protein [Ulvibacterium sp.]|uniref:hypothetical protein n=1 Tax=Ulvibacterium sp. TaxID=2665914 RepID=UPI003BA8ABC6